MNNLKPKIGLLFLMSAFFVGAASAKPNIMLILVDDMGYSDLGCYGGEIKTPAIDGLASNGVRYAQFYNCARCWPTRAALMSGYYPHQVNRDAVLDISGGPGRKNKRPAWAKLVPEYLKSAGYRSHHAGKWDDVKPIENGFDQSLHIADPDRFFSPQEWYLNDNKQAPVKRSDGFFATTAIAEHTIEFLKEHKANHPDQPFFSYVAFKAPHFPLHALPEDIARVGDRYAVGWDTIRNQRWERLQKMGLVTGKLSEADYNQGIAKGLLKELEVLGAGEVFRPVPWNELTKKKKTFQQAKMSIHAAMIERVDIEVDRIIDQLKAMDAFDDTLIFFLSDNGATRELMVRGDGHDPSASPGSAGSYLCLGPGWATACNTPFRKYKKYSHEGGACTPFIAHWPNGMSAKGAINQTPGHAIDLVPTILDVAGVTVADQKVPFPGTSLFSDDVEQRRMLWWSHKGNHAVRLGNWKLVKVNQAKWELFNLAEDRTETNDLSASHPEKVKELEKMWLAQVEQFRQNKQVK